MSTFEHDLSFLMKHPGHTKHGTSESMFNSMLEDANNSKVESNNSMQLVYFESCHKVCFGVLVNCNRNSCHVSIVCGGEDTVMGQASPQAILCLTPECAHIDSSQILKIRTIALENILLVKFRESFYIRVYHPKQCSIQLLPFKCTKPFECFACENKKLRTISVDRGDCIVFESNLKLKTFNYFDKTVEDQDYDEILFPERYRKQYNDHLKDCYVSHDLTCCVYIGYVQNVVYDDHRGEEYLKVNLFYRPQNVYEDYETFRQASLNLLFWTEATVQISKTSVLCKCRIILADNLETNVYEDDLFYFHSCYDPLTQQVYPPNKSLSKLFSTNKNTESLPATSLTVLDVFSGCGGLFYGFKSFTDKVYAIDDDRAATETFKHNFDNSIIINSDANLVLQTLNDPGDAFIRQNLPQKGEIDIILGGPPCQGFSRMNRFSSSECSMFKSSLVGTFLNYIEHYRPKYCLFENVRSLIDYKKSQLFKAILSFLTRLDYQFRVEILQAGCYGVPQNRKRLFIIASLPDCRLAAFPNPTHLFARRHCNTSFIVDQVKYDPVPAVGRGLYRMITVEDAIADLPKLEQDEQFVNRLRQYRSKRPSHFQKIMQTRQGTLSDHYCKRLAAINLERIKHIPRQDGADWRDLPNIELVIDGSTRLAKLRYQHCTKKHKLKGVCPCVHGQPCGAKAYRQSNTLIPWCLAHTADRQNHWAGLYGRLSWKGFFPTTVTSPEPISQQGKVIHPLEDRLLSVREMARSQGFPDSFVFHGTAIDKYRQIGNAVPPLLSIALARQIKNALQSPPDGAPYRESH